MSDPATTIAFARRYLGVKEGPPANSNHQRFGVWYGMDYVAWCAIFASFCLYMTGVRFKGATTAKGFSYVPAIIAWGQKTKRISRTPHPGDLACKVDRGLGHHVGLVTTVKGRNFGFISGNTSTASFSNGGGVAEKPQNADHGWVFVTPPYSSLKPVPIPPKPRPAPNTKAGPITRNWVLTTPTAVHPQIKWAQQKLAGYGYAISKADGFYGSQTAAAVRAFQKHCGLEADGILGPVTGAHLVTGK